MYLRVFYIKNMLALSFAFYWLEGERPKEWMKTNKGIEKIERKNCEKLLIKNWECINSGEQVDEDNYIWRENKKGVLYVWFKR